ncbi:LysR family transcriptional regulator [Bradyrhizobium sp. INPA03-11B]|uniref:LysR family transcriptional regulator n=1 Tax=Bradyrhizobium sp. INPA03-11B TaxID=418598 RepID=UPI00338FFDB6
MAAEHDEVPLNAIRASVTIARERSVTRAATALGTTQSSVSRYLAVLQEYFGTDLVERRGRRSELTEFGSLFANTVAEPLDTLCFTAKRMRHRSQPEANRIVVRTSLSNFAFSLLVHDLHRRAARSVPSFGSASAPSASRSRQHASRGYSS